MSGNNTLKLGFVLDSNNCLVTPTQENKQSYGFKMCEAKLEGAVWSVWLDSLRVAIMSGNELVKYID